MPLLQRPYTVCWCGGAGQRWLGEHPAVVGQGQPQKRVWQRGHCELPSLPSVCLTVGWCDEPCWGMHQRWEAFPPWAGLEGPTLS
jgi:hypothetical protein